MIQCRVFIENEHDYLDRSVCVEISLPCVPPVGSTLFIGEDLCDELERKAKNLDVAWKYAPTWFYGKSYDVERSDITEETLQDLSFEDAIFVCSVAFEANSNFVNLVLNTSGVAAND